MSILKMPLWCGIELAPLKEMMVRLVRVPNTRKGGTTHSLADSCTDAHIFSALGGL